MTTDIFRFVNLVMLEDMAHAGAENGLLIVTHQQCRGAGIHRDYIRQAQDASVARGLVYRCTEPVPWFGRGRAPNRWGLGWRAGHDGSAAPNRWKAWRSPHTSKIINSSPIRRDLKQGRKSANGHAVKPIKVPYVGTDKVPYVGTETINGEVLREVKSLPPGFWLNKRGRVMTKTKPRDGEKPELIEVPTVLDAMVGDERHREAYARLQAGLAQLKKEVSANGCNDD
jgi:hypothetical protein